MSKYHHTGYNEAAHSEKRRIVLVGKTGVGKSSAGNTILGKDEFEIILSAGSVTAKCKKAKGNIDSREVAVIDTPGLFDTNFTQEEVLTEIKKCISLSSPGPHAFLVVLQLGSRFTQEEKDTVKMIQETFGEDAAKYTMVLFTHGDRLKKQTIEGYMKGSPDLKAFIRSLNDRYHVFNNEIKDPEQTKELLDKIDKMTKKNGGSFYTNEMFKKAEEAIEKEKQRLLKEKEAERQRELDQLKVSCSASIYPSEERRVNGRYESKARALAERSNEFILDPTVLSAVAGAAAGAVAGAVAGGEIGGTIGSVGGPMGMAVGAAAGAAVGVVAGALSIKVSDRCSIQ